MFLWAGFWYISEEEYETNKLTKIKPREEKQNVKLFVYTTIIDIISLCCCCLLIFDCFSLIFEAIFFFCYDFFRWFVLLNSSLSLNICISLIERSLNRSCVIAVVVISWVVWKVSWENRFIQGIAIFLVVVIPHSLEGFKCEK